MLQDPTRRPPALSCHKELWIFFSLSFMPHSIKSLPSFLVDKTKCCPFIEDSSLIVVGFQANSASKFGGKFAKVASVEANGPH